MMKRVTKILSTLALGTLIATTAVAGDKKKLDPETGLILGKGFDEVKANCTVCHSAKFIILQKGDRDTWLQMIRWMQATQGLWNFDEKTENTILTYLATNYPPVEGGRRSNLPHTMLPPNPYDKK
jgi:hypothetical protein